MNYLKLSAQLLRRIQQGSVSGPEKRSAIMARIPIDVTETQFDQRFRPHLSTAKRGYECKIPLYKVFNYIIYKLRTGVQWEFLPLDDNKDGQPEISYQVPSYHFCKWSRDGSLQKLFDASVMTIKGELNLSELNLDGSHSAAKKGAKKLPIKAARKPRPAIFCH
jgi:transposase